MALNTFYADSTADAQEVNENFSGLADGTEIADDAIVTRHIADDQVTSDHIETQEAWTEVTYLNNWVAYDTDGTYGGWYYMKDSMGFVHLQGMGKDGDSATDIMFTLPAGYRPNKRLIFAVRNVATTACRLDIKENGEVNQQSQGSTTWCSISGVTFKADQ